MVFAGWRALIKNTFIAIEEKVEAAPEPRSKSAEPCFGRTRSSQSAKEKDNLLGLNKLLETMSDSSLRNLSPPLNEALTFAKTTIPIIAASGETSPVGKLVKRMWSNNSVSTMAPSEDDCLESDEFVDDLGRGDFEFEMRGFEDNTPSQSSSQHASVTEGELSLKTQPHAEKRHARVVSPKPGSELRRAGALGGERLEGASENGGLGPTQVECSHALVPKKINLAEEFQNSGTSSPPTTVMLRNIPNKYTQQMFIDELETMEFSGCYDFLYLPMDKCTRANVGYAFVNFTDHIVAERALEHFTNYRFIRQKHGAGKVATASVAHIQGLENNLNHFQNTAVNAKRSKQNRPVVLAHISKIL